MGKNINLCFSLLCTEYSRYYYFFYEIYIHNKPIVNYYICKIKLDSSVISIFLSL